MWVDLLYPHCQNRIKDEYIALQLTIRKSFADRFLNVMKCGDSSFSSFMRPNVQKPKHICITVIKDK